MFAQRESRSHRILMKTSKYNQLFIPFALVQQWANHKERRSVIFVETKETDGKLFHCYEFLNFNETKNVKKMKYLQYMS